jgi:hypothetical protein
LLLAFPAGAGEPFATGAELFAACIVNEKPDDPSWTERDSIALTFCRNYLWQEARKRGYPETTLAKVPLDSDPLTVLFCPGHAKSPKVLFGWTNPGAYTDFWITRGVTELSSLPASQAAMIWLRDTHGACEQAAPDY